MQTSIIYLLIISINLFACRPRQATTENTQIQKNETKHQQEISSPPSVEENEPFYVGNIDSIYIIDPELATKNKDRQLNLSSEELSTGEVAVISSVVSVVATAIVVGGIGAVAASRVKAKNHLGNDAIPNPSKLGKISEPVKIPRIDPTVAKKVTPDEIEINKSLILGEGIDGTVKVKVVQSIDAVDLSDWTKPQYIAFNKGVLDSILTRPGKIPTVITQGPYQITLFGIKDDFMVAQITKDLPLPGRTLHEIFPNFTPDKQLGGGITGDAFFGQYAGQPVVGKRVNQYEYGIIQQLQGSTGIVPILNQGWRQTDNGVVDFGIIMERAQRDGKAAIEDSNFDFDKFALDISESVYGMHQKGLVHLDLKPENVLQLKDGRFVLSDFGETRQFNHAVSPSASDPRFREPWRPMGPFMATPISDSYALGAMLGFVYLKKVKGIDIQEPDFKLLEAWRNAGSKPDDHNLAEYFRQTNEFKTRIHDELGKISSTDPKAKTMFDMIQDPNKHKIPTIDALINVLKIGK